MSKDKVGKLIYNLALAEKPDELYLFNTIPIKLDKTVSLEAKAKIISIISFIESNISSPAFLAIKDINIGQKYVHKSVTYDKSIFISSLIDLSIIDYYILWEMCHFVFSYYYTSIIEDGLIKKEYYLKRLKFINRITPDIKKNIFKNKVTDTLLIEEMLIKPSELIEEKNVYNFIFNDLAKLEKKEINYYLEDIFVSINSLGSLSDYFAEMYIWYCFLKRKKAKLEELFPEVIKKINIFQNFKENMNASKDIP